MVWECGKVARVNLQRMNQLLPITLAPLFHISTPERPAVTVATSDASSIPNPRPRPGWAPFKMNHPALQQITLRITKIRNLRDENKKKELEIRADKDGSAQAVLGALSLLQQYDNQLYDEMERLLDWQKLLRR